MSSVAPLGRFESRGDIGIIWINHPPVNAISAGVRQAIVDGCKALAADPALKAGVLACEGRTFMAGADITEFSRAPQGPSWIEMLDALEGCSKPIVAAIHGTAFGGGLENALACHYRVATPTAQVGLPEVKLGILPGAGGTQRLPRLVGAEMGLEAIASGDPIPAKVAAKAGVIDAIIEGDLLEGAIAFAKDVIAKGAKLRKVRDMTIDPATVPAGFFEAARARFAKEKRNLFAPQRIVDAVEAAVKLPKRAWRESGS
jgi:3-hydroxyacyl-CoA dehydrogenase